MKRFVLFILLSVLCLAGEAFAQEVNPNATDDPAWQAVLTGKSLKIPDGFPTGPGAVQLRGLDRLGKIEKTPYNYDLVGGRPLQGNNIIQHLARKQNLEEAAIDRPANVHYFLHRLQDKLRSAGMTAAVMDSPFLVNSAKSDSHNSIHLKAQNMILFMWYTTNESGEDNPFSTDINYEKGGQDEYQIGSITARRLEKIQAKRPLKRDTERDLHEGSRINTKKGKLYVKLSSGNGENDENWKHLDDVSLLTRFEGEGETEGGTDKAKDKNELRKLRSLALEPPFPGPYILNVRKEWELIKAIATVEDVAVAVIALPEAIRTQVLDYARSIHEEPALISRVEKLMEVKKNNGPLLSSRNPPAYMTVILGCSVRDRMLGCEGPTSSEGEELLSRIAGKLLRSSMDGDRLVNANDLYRAALICPKNLGDQIYDIRTKGKQYKGADRSAFKVFQNLMSRCGRMPTGYQSPENWAKALNESEPSKVSILVHGHPAMTPEWAAGFDKWFAGIETERASRLLMNKAFLKEVVLAADHPGMVPYLVKILEGGAVHRGKGADNRAKEEFLKNLPQTWLSGKGNARKEDTLKYMPEGLGGEVENGGKDKGESGSRDRSRASRKDDSLKYQQGLSVLRKVSVWDMLEWTIAMLSVSEMPAEDMSREKWLSYWKGVSKKVARKSKDALLREALKGANVKLKGAETASAANLDELSKAYGNLLKAAPILALNVHAVFLRACDGAVPFPVWSAEERSWHEPDALANWYASNRGTCGGAEGLSPEEKGRVIDREMELLSELYLGKTAAKSMKKRASKNGKKRDRSL